MAELGFERVGAQYQHPDTPFFVEFPRGPLAIGDDDMVEPVEVRVGQARVWASGTRPHVGAAHFRRSLKNACSRSRHSAESTPDTTVTR
jgi:hypothetical protein